jgi:hypothetical protein
VAYLIAGIVVGQGLSYAPAAIITLATGIVLLAVAILVIRLAGKKKKA